MNRPLYIGIDGGGTKTELLAGRRGEGETVQRTGKKSNLQLVGLEQSIGVLSDLIKEAQSMFEEQHIGRICVGLSGAGRPHEQRAVRRALAEELGVSLKSIQVVSDAEIAVEAAFEGSSGVLVIAGTGSMACGRTDRGEFSCAGGWGRLLGDEGSGYAIGRAGLQAVAAAVDGGPRTTLVDHVRELFGAVSKPVLVHRVYGEEWPIQEFAPHVLQSAADGDTEADRILREQTEMLARRVRWLVQRHEESFEKRVALIGGLSNAPVYREAFNQALDELLPGWHVERSAAEPAAGALRMALSDA